MPLITVHFLRYVRDERLLYAGISVPSPLVQLGESGQYHSQQAQHRPCEPQVVLCVEGFRLKTLQYRKVLLRCVIDSDTNTNFQFNPILTRLGNEF